MVSRSSCAYVARIADIPPRIRIMTKSLKDALAIASFVATTVVFIGVHVWMYTH